MRLPLTALLSQALVAFTIEFDNEFERRIPHWTTNQAPPAGSREGPWLVSLAMWSNCMQFVGEAGATVGDIEALARTRTNWNGLERWGYIVRSGQMVRATAEGRQAQTIWRPLFAEIEERWDARFGKVAIDALRGSLRELAGQIDEPLPDCLPILNYGLFSSAPERPKPGAAVREDDDVARLPLSALLSRLLLARALEFERESDVSLAISADVVRILDDGKGVRQRDLPLLSGVSKEAISAATGILQKKRLASVEPEEPASRTKLVRLTPKGRDAQDAYRRLLDAVEKRWQARAGKDALGALRVSLERLAGDSTAEGSPLWRGLEPYADGWRASVRRPATLPHYPMVLHRGGYPDGS